MSPKKVNVINGGEKTFLESKMLFSDNYWLHFFALCNQKILCKTMCLLAEILLEMIECTLSYL